MLDNFSPHKRPEVLDWCSANNVELAFLPTNASWRNWIEPEFTAVRYFALNGTDHPSHAEQDAAIDAYSNQDATGKRGFAVRSKIRRPDYMIDVA